MKKIKICTPVIGKTLAQFLINLDRVQEISEMIELRVDEIKNLKKKDLSLIRTKTFRESILTSRRKKIILEATDMGFDFIDIDLTLILKLNSEDLKKNNIILSFHDFKKTPDASDLEEIINTMRKLKPSVIKIATKVNNRTDIKNLLSILLNKREEERMIIIGMGPEGRVIRIVGPLLGSFLTFASTEYGKSADGQIDINEVKNIYTTVNF